MQLTPVIESKLADMEEMIYAIPGLELLQKNFYQKLINVRYMEVLLPTYRKGLEQKR